MKRFLIPSLLIASLGWVHARSNALYESSSYWPPKLKLVEPFYLPGDGHALSAGRHGVLIRIEKKADDSEVLIVDFGSAGVHALRPEATDVATRVQNYKLGLESKSFPNWTMMIGRAFLRISADEAVPIQLKDIAEYEKMLIIYVDKQSLEGAENLYGKLAAAKEELEKNSTLLLIMPMNFEDRLALSEPIQLAERHRIEFFYMYHYLAASYVNSMHHGIDMNDLPACVLVDVEGRTIVSSREISNWKKDCDLKPILKRLD